MAQTETVNKIATTQPANPAPSRTQKVSSAKQENAQRARIEAAVRKLADVASEGNTDLSFSVDSSSDQVVVKVTDANTGKVIRQIPSEELLRIARNVREMLGLFYDHKG